MPYDKPSANKQKGAMILDTTALLAEFLGTFLFVLTIFASGGNPFFIGGMFTLALFLVKKYSGGHLNPAVSVAMYLRGSLSWKELLFYAIAQVTAAAASLYTYRALA
jgi:aquaporin Z